MNDCAQTSSDIGFGEIRTGAFSFIYKNIALLGMETYRYARRIFRSVGRLLIRPLRVIAAWLRLLLLAVDHFGLKSARAFNSEARYLRSEVKSALRYIRKASKSSPYSIIYILAHYVKKALRRHRQFFRSALNILLPAVSLAVLIITVNRWNNITYALQIIYDGKTVGYISDESVYLESRNLAVQKLSVGLKENERSDILSKPKYSLALVSVNDLVDVDTLSENLLEASDANITNACGIYIDGVFLCSVKNENDARSVFNAILEKQTVRSDEKVGFIEEIDYVQGLFPDDENTMWDAARLAGQLSKTKQAQMVYTARYGDSFSKIADDFDMTVEKLRELNPGLAAANKILVGDTVVISQEVKFVRVKVVRTESHAVDVNYDTVVTYNSSLFRGDSRVIRNGVKGLDLVTTQITTIDGVVYSTEEIDRVRITDPIDEKIEKGTRSTSVSSAYGTYNVTVSSKGFVWPAPTARTVSQSYGRYGHRGIDITTSGASGRVIVAAASGTVEIAGSVGDSYGQQVLINHGNGVKTRYAHCLSGSINVRPGQRVSAGQTIARIGSTGNSTGPHLHFEVIVNGSSVNPMYYVSR